MSELVTDDAAVAVGVGEAYAAALIVTEVSEYEL
jgi:hypothetical protein